MKCHKGSDRDSDKIKEKMDQNATESLVVSGTNSTGLSLSYPTLEKRAGGNLLERGSVLSHGIRVRWPVPFLSHLSE